MTKSSYEQALKTLEKTFEDRFRRPSDDNETKSGALASVLPLHAQEVELLTREAARYSMPLAAVGGGTSPEPVAEEGKLLVRFDLMRGVRLPPGDGGWVEAEPGTSWLKLDEELCLREMGLAVYPTSAPALRSGAGWPQTGWGWAPSSTAGFGKTSCRPAWCCLAVSSAHPKLIRGLYQGSRISNRCSGASSEKGARNPAPAS